MHPADVMLSHAENRTKQNKLAGRGCEEVGEGPSRVVCQSVTIRGRESGCSDKGQRHVLEELQSNLEKWRSNARAER